MVADRHPRSFGWMVFGAVTLGAAVLAGCGGPSPTISPSPGALVEPTAFASASPPASATPRPSATSRPSAPASPTPSASTPASATATLPHCSGTVSGAHGGTLTDSSRNWSGYVAIASHATVSCVEAYWTQPAIACPAKGRSEVSIWVGIGGAGDADTILVQTGTDVACRSGSADYTIWTEVYPLENERVIEGLSVKAGDRVWAKVSVVGHAFTLVTANLTTDRISTKHESVKGTHRLTADWIVEAPAAGCPSRCAILPLARFDHVRFSGSQATIGGVLGTIDRWRHDVVTMYEGNTATRRAVVSGLHGSGSFSVAWRHR